MATKISILARFIASQSHNRRSGWEFCKINYKICEKFNEFFTKQLVPLLHNNWEDNIGRNMNKPFRNMLILIRPKKASKKTTLTQYIINIQFFSLPKYYYYTLMGRRKAHCWYIKTRLNHQKINTRYCSKKQQLLFFRYPKQFFFVC